MLHPHDRFVISSAHVKQIERSPRQAVLFPQHSSKPLYSLHYLDSDSDDSNDEDQQIFVDLASVNVIASSSKYNQSSTWLHDPDTNNHNAIETGKRRKARQKRWSDERPSSPSDCDTLLHNELIKGLLNQYWLELCAEARIDPNNETKRVKYRVWVIFFRRLEEVVPDWDSEECSLLPGKKKMNLFFTKDEFCSFFFFDILAPRCGFATRAKSYLVLGKRLYRDIFNPEAMEAAERVGCYISSSSPPRARTASKSTRGSNNNSNSTRAYRTRSNSQSDSKYSDDKSKGDAYNNNDDDCDYDGVDGRGDGDKDEEDEDEDGGKDNNNDLSTQLRQTLVHTYSLLCPHNDLVELRHTHMQHQSILHELNRAPWYNVPSRHRLATECLSTDDQLLRSKIQRWSITSNVSKMWVCSTSHENAIASLLRLHNYIHNRGGVRRGASVRSSTSSASAANQILRVLREMEEQSKELKDNDALRFGQDCAMMFDQHMKMYCDASRRTLGMRPLLQNMLSGKYTQHQEAGNRNKNWALSWGVTQLTFDMSAPPVNRPSQMRGTVAGYGIVVSDQLRMHYTLEGSFDWSRGDVVLIRHNGASRTSTSQGTHGIVDRFVGQMIVLPCCLLIKCRKMGGDNCVDNGSFLLMTNYNKTTLSLENLRLSIEKEEEKMQEKAGTKIQRKTTKQGRSVVKRRRSSCRYNTKNEQEEIKPTPPPTYSVPVTIPKSKTTTISSSQQQDAGSVDANLRAFANTQVQQIDIKKKVVQKHRADLPSWSKTNAWKRETKRKSNQQDVLLSQQLHVNASNNRIPAKRPNCTPGKSATSSAPSSPRSMIPLRTKNKYGSRHLRVAGTRNSGAHFDSR